MMEAAIVNGICRCCASEGSFKDIRSAYQWMGAEEIYADMLKECFDINLWSSDLGEDGGICEVCITQLRNASNFKKQVLHTEDQFKKHLHTKLFKPSIVKVELPMNDGDDSDDIMSAEEGYSGTDFEMPIKSESPEEPKPKKRAAAKVSTRATTSRAKKAKTDAGETSTKRVGCPTEIKLDPDVSKILHMLKTPRSAANITTDWTVSIKKPRPQLNQQRIPLSTKGLMMSKKGVREIDLHLHNIRTILVYSNATPIRSHGGAGYSCYFCMKQYPKAIDLKTHTNDIHDNNAKSKFMGQTMKTLVVKLDITALQCKLCDENIDSLEQLTEHLKKEHGMKLYSHIKNHILPFKFDSEDLSCVMCPQRFVHFKLLQEHMNHHYSNYVCHICCAPFVNQRTLQYHLTRHGQGEFACSRCPKVFNTLAKKQSHERCVHVIAHKRNVCHICYEKFASYEMKRVHMVKVHGADPIVLKCMACDETFYRRDKLRRHTKKFHLMEKNFECDHCEMKFYAKKELVCHMLKHTGVKNYRCEVCSKSFGRSYTLKEHLRIHADDRRFQCLRCGQSFVQKCSWKSHMLSKHDEYV